LQVEGQICIFCVQQLDFIIDWIIQVVHSQCTIWMLGLIAKGDWESIVGTWSWSWNSNFRFIMNNKCWWLSPLWIIWGIEISFHGFLHFLMNFQRLKLEWGLGFKVRCNWLLHYYSLCVLLLHCCLFTLIVFKVWIFKVRGKD